MTNLYHTKNGQLVPVIRKRLATEDQLQAWVASNPRLIGLEILVLGREITTAFGGKIDVFGLDRDGNTVVIECKRDRTPRDIIGQVLDYASWVSSLSTRQIHDITLLKLGKPLEIAFQERFGSEVPEVLNDSHSLVIVASEFDASSRRIVEYLAEVHDIAINTAFFNTFEHNGELLLTTDWLLDQEEVTQRAESKAKAPWTGLWYYNVGHELSRSWEDMLKYNFIAAGGGRIYSDPLKKLSPGDRFFAYQKGEGYVGYGVVVAPAVPVNDFKLQDKPILSLPLKADGFDHDANDIEKCEWLVSVEWLKAYPLAEAKTFNGVFANQNIVCKLRDTATLDFLKRVFPVETERPRFAPAVASAE